MHAHRPVLLDTVVDSLAIKPDGVYLDATFGRGGHARAILGRLGPQGRLLVMDRDPEALAVARDLAAVDARVSVSAGPFSTLGQVVEAAGLTGALDGVLLDIGVSSPQLDDAARGFSFQQRGPLDMRMDPTSGESAADLVARASVDELADTFRELGEERFAGRIARAIVQARSEAPIADTQRLAEVVSAAVPKREPGKHPATRVFQALRLRVNRELEELTSVLPQVVRALKAGGRLVVIAFHSLEDRIVKRFLRDEAKGDHGPDWLPVPVTVRAPTLRLIGKAQFADAAELALNPRARSAVLRVAERL
jgi:16S rRNA (cytosine1402-N4)-methyltransferase